MPLSAGRAEFTTCLKWRLAAFGLWAATLLAVCGCAESPPVPPVPPVPPIVVVPIPNVDPSEPVSNFDGLSANTKLDLIAEVIRTSWGDGKGFLYVPGAATTESSEDPLVLTLRWQPVEKKVAPLLQRAFGIEGTLVCRFTSPGEFECNHPMYQLAIQRAQNRKEEYADLHYRVDAAISNKAPVLRDQFLQQVERQVEFYKAIRSSLTDLALPGQLEFSQDDKDSSVDDQQCVLLTKWTALPAEFENSTEAGSFQWRLKLVIREAVDKLESEWDNLGTEKNRLELVSFAQYRNGQGEPFEPLGPLSITAMGFDADTTIMHWGKRFNSRRFSISHVLESLEPTSSVSAYPNPATVVGVNDPTRILVASVHKAIQEHLTEGVPE